MEDMGFTKSNSYTLSLLTMAFIFGEISHFLVGVVSMEMARSLHFGDKACFQHPNESIRFGRTNAECDKFTADAVPEDVAAKACHSHQGCLYLENGQGMKYQILAGPTFVVVFTISGIVMGYLADKVAR